MNKIAEILRINEQELEQHIPYKASWHQKYAHSAWVYIGGLPYELTEGDTICVMSQFGELEDIHLVRDEKTGKSKGFAFIKYENQLSTVLAVDNMNGAKLLERTINVDHVDQYKLPKHVRERHEDQSSEEDQSREDTPPQRGLPGHAYEGKELETNHSLLHGHDLFAPVPETKKERKRKRKVEKKARKVEKKARKVEKKNQVLRKTETEAAVVPQDIQTKSVMKSASTTEPSNTGWRGRYEPRDAVVVSKSRTNHNSQGSKHKPHQNHSRRDPIENHHREEGYGGQIRRR